MALLPWSRSWLLLALAATACAPTLAPVPAPSASAGPEVRRSAAPSANPSAGPSAATAPSANPSAGPSAAAAPSARPSAGPSAATAPALRALVQPVPGALVLTGVARLDAAYVVGAGAGRILSNNGGSVLALGTFISDQGGGVLSNNGGNLISDQGGEAVADWSRGYRLAADEALPFGTLAPAAGMAIRLYDLERGAFVALGARAGGGEPVYEVLSDAAGGYAVTAGSDPSVLMQVAELDARLPDAVVIEAGLAAQGPDHWLEQVFSARNVPCVTVRGDGRRTRCVVDRLLQVVA